LTKTVNYHGLIIAQNTVSWALEARRRIAEYREKGGHLRRSSALNRP